MIIRLNEIIRGISDGLCRSIDARLGAGTADKCGVKRIVEAVIEEHGIPTEPVDLPMTFARNVLGILPEAPRRKTRYPKYMGARKLTPTGRVRRGI